MLSVCRSTTWHTSTFLELLFHIQKHCWACRENLICIIGPGICTTPSKLEMSVWLYMRSRANNTWGYSCQTTKSWIFNIIWQPVTGNSWWYSDSEPVREQLYEKGKQVLLLYKFIQIGSKWNFQQSAQTKLFTYYGRNSHAEKHVLGIDQETSCMAGNSLYHYITGSGSRMLSYPQYGDCASMSSLQWQFLSSTNWYLASLLL